MFINFSCYLLKFIILFLYKINVFNLENIPKNKGVLLVGNHISYLDWVILQIIYHKQIIFIMDKDFAKKMPLKWLFFNLFKKISLQKSNYLNKISDVFESGGTVVLFAEGFLTRNGHINNFLQDYQQIINTAHNKKTVIVPFYLHGLRGSRFCLTNNSIFKNSKSITVYFGSALDKKTAIHNIKEKVIDLSLIAWNEEITKYESIANLWLENIKNNSNKNFFVTDSIGASFNNKKFLTAVLLMRTWLKKSIANEKNIGIILPSSSYGAITNMAVLTLAKIVINLNYTQVATIQNAIDKTEIKTIITSKKFIQKLVNMNFDITDVLIKLRVLYLEDMADFASKKIKISYYLRALIYPTWLLKKLFITKQSINDKAAILFSSGSENDPKGIVLTNKSIIANVKQIKIVLNSNFNNKIMATLPTFHSFGLTVCTILPLLELISVIYHTDPTDASNIGKLISKYKATIILATGTFLRIYENNKKLKSSMLESINFVIAGAEKLSVDIRQKFKQKFNKDIYEGYGTTETSPVISCNAPDIDILVANKWQTQKGQKYGTVGKPLPGTKVIITNPETFQKLDVHEQGMILVSGPQVMHGYLKNNDKTNEVIKLIDGVRYYVTGDKGEIDKDGFITIIDRYTRFAKIGGEMISLSNLEEQIKNIVNNIELCATNIKDSKKGEKIVLFYVCDITVNDFKKQLITAKINSLHLPSVYYKLDKMPYLAAGKVNFQLIKKLAETFEQKNEL